MHNITHKYEQTSVIDPVLLPLIHKLLSNAWLIKTGYLNSLIDEKVTDKYGLPIPWYTYTAIAFLRERINKNLTVFEFGLGNSTIWWAKRSKSVTSIDNNMDWINKIKPSLPNNVNIIYKELIYGGRYSHILHEIMTNNRQSEYKFSIDIPDAFDIIIVDGRDRTNCIYNSLHFLSQSGVIILDNANRKHYKPGIEFLKNNGFINIKFYGLTPCVTHENITQIFYRNNNCLDI